MNWRGGDTVLRSHKELQQVDMYVYTAPGGLLGRFIGRALRFAVKDFSFYIGKGDQALRKVEVSADSLLPQCEVFPDSHFERCRLGYHEVDRLLRRTTGFTLDAARYPTIEFEVLREGKSTKSLGDAARKGWKMFSKKKETDESKDKEPELPPIAGRLSLRGETQEIECSRAIEGAELVVRCPVSLKQFKVPKYKLWMGLFTVDDMVEVQTRVPLSVFKSKKDKI